MCYELARLIIVENNFIVSGQIKAECLREKIILIVIDMLGYVLITATVVVTYNRSQ